MITREKLRDDFIKNCKIINYKIEALKADASFRRYFRITTKDKSYILMDAPPEKEDIVSFIEVDEFLNSKNLSAPEIFNKDLKNGFLLLADFGDFTYSYILSNKHKYVDIPDEKRLYERAIDVLIHLHKNCENKTLPHYNNNLLIKESMLFIEWYIAVLNGENINIEHQDKFVTILKQLFEQLENFPEVTVLRDYHADNLLWLDEEIGIKKVGLLDFQDAVIGCPVYDIVSLLEDARRDVPEDIVINSISRYLKAFPQYTRKEFMALYNIIGVQRNLKIIGIFTRQASKYKNTHYLTYLPRVWAHVHNNLKHPLLLPLKNWLDEVLPSQTEKDSSKSNAKKVLV